MPCAASRRAAPTADLASVIANAELGGHPLPDMDMLGHYLIIATPCHDTTSNTIGGGLLALIENRDQLELLGRLEHIELAGQPTWIQAYFVQGPKSIPISYRLR